MGVAQSGTSPVQRVHFRAVSIKSSICWVPRNIRYADEPDAHILGLCCDPSNCGRESVTQVSLRHGQGLYGMERKRRRRVC
jgi:hypothetical protein